MTLLTRINTQSNLTQADIKSLIEILIDPSIDNTIKYEFLNGYSQRTINYQELTYIVKALINTMYPKQPYYEGGMCVCGTGGDKSNSFNISTTVSFVVASAGVNVIKHGNKSVTSASGSTDLLTRMQINTSSVEETPQQLSEKHLSFISATESYPIMKHMQPVRKMVGRPTIFNLVGPLINPYHLTYQMMGLFDGTKIEIVAKTMRDLGRRKAIVVHGANGMDEATLSGNNIIYEINGKDEIKHYTLNAQDIGLSYASNDTLIGGSVDENFNITLNILNGTDRSSKRDVVLLNAALCLYVAEKTSDIQSGVKLAANLIDNGHAMQQYLAMGGCQK